MLIGTMKVKIYVPWSHSLKEKRMVVKSICAKVRNNFNISVAEVEEQDIHQIIVLGLACVGNEASHADSMLDHVLNFIEENTEAEIIGVEREMI